MRVNSAHNDQVSQIRRCFSLWKSPQVHVAARYAANPHGEDATIRSAATTLMSTMFNSIGMSVYDVQKNSNVMKGSSVIYDPIDVTMTNDAMPPNCALKMVDVDYYLDMPQLLASFKPTIIYTQVPSGTHENPKTPSHTFHIQDDKVSYTSHCGYVACHGLWNYGADYLRCFAYTNLICRILGLKSVYHYRVLRMSFPRGRSVIALVPHHYLPWYARFLAFLCKRHDLRKYKLNHTGTNFQWTAFELFTEDGTYVCVGGADPHSHPIQTQKSKFDLVIDTARHALSKPTEHAVHNITRRSDTFLLADYAIEYIKYKHQLDCFHLGKGDYDNYESSDHEEECSCAYCKTVKQPNVDPIDYQVGKHATQDKPKSAVSQVGSSPVRDATVVAPVRDKAAARSAIDNRIAEMQIAAEKKVDKVFVLQKIKPFITALFKRIKVGNPYTTQEVLDRVKPQARPALTEAAPHMLVKHLKPILDAFIKAETYNEPKPPRLIQPLDPLIAGRLFKYSYALQDALHTLPAFAFGRPTRELAKHICELSSDALTKAGFEAYELDFKRYDGTVTELMRKVELEIYKAAFPLHTKEITEVHQATYNRVGKLQNVLYHTGFSRCSGSPDTCLMNTLLNMFAMYCALGDRAFTCGVYGGDDSLLFIKPSDEATIIDAVDKCGFTAKPQARNKNQPFTFLSRYFMWGSVNSCADVKRALPKLHILNHAGIPPKYLEPRLAMKLKSLADSDSNTPILGKAIKEKLQWLDNKGVKTNVKIPSHLFSFWELFLATLGPWPNEREDWMNDVVVDIEDMGDGSYSFRRKKPDSYIHAVTVTKLPDANKPKVPLPIQIANQSYHSTPDKPAIKLNIVRKKDRDRKPDPSSGGPTPAHAANVGPLDDGALNNPQSSQSPPKAKKSVTFNLPPSSQSEGNRSPRSPQPASAGSTADSISGQPKVPGNVKVASSPPNERLSIDKPTVPGNVKVASSPPTITDDDLKQVLVNNDLVTDNNKILSPCKDGLEGQDIAIDVEADSDMTIFQSDYSFYKALEFYTTQFSNLLCCVSIVQPIDAITIMQTYVDANGYCILPNRPLVANSVLFREYSLGFDPAMHYYDRVIMNNFGSENTKTLEKPNKDENIENSFDVTKDDKDKKTPKWVKYQSHMTLLCQYYLTHLQKVRNIVTSEQDTGINKNAAPIDDQDKFNPTTWLDPQAVEETK